ncbi:pleckstrin homology domain-containing family A member 4-like isoform X2 [Leucoraja erinacea]|nr:pleckstrin homology domain-containing family A member 4-like isoform X2 [Leucoraja erinacea]
MSVASDRPRSGLSLGSSVGTIASLANPLGSKPLRPLRKVHNFGKREQAIKRDPNSATVMRGWLHKQDSSGLKLWKRRWFVLSDFCLFYYRDSREERILGSIPMPSYNISAIDPQDRKNRKFAFKAEHPGMRTYCFSADTQDDMNGWIRAMGQSARVETDFTGFHSTKVSKPVPQERQYCSYKDLTESALQHNNAQSAESLEIANLSKADPWVKLQEEAGTEARRHGSLLPTDSHRADTSFTISLERLTPPARNGAVPPPTPTSAFHSAVFNFEGSPKPELTARDVQRTTSLSHVEQWVQSQKEELPDGEEDEQYLVTTQSGHVYECLVDGFPISSVNSRLHSGRSTPTEGGRRREAVAGPGERPRPPGLASYRCSSLPPAAPGPPSAPPRYQVLRRSLTPDGRYLSTHHRPCVTPTPPASRPPTGLHPRVEAPPPGLLPPCSRGPTRPHTPVGRIDVLPPQQPAVAAGNGHLQPGLLTARVRGQASRPQTPASRLDVLPTDDHHGLPPLHTLRSRHRPGDRPPLDERDSVSMATLSSRCYRPCPRLLYPPHSPVDRTRDRSLSRHRPPSFAVGYPPHAPSISSPWGSALRLSAAAGSCSSFIQLPPRPPTSPRAGFVPVLPAVRRLSLAPSVNGGAVEIYPEFTAEPIKMAESEVDVLLTRLCGQDRVLQGLVAEATPLKIEKDKLEGALEVTRGQLAEFGGQQSIGKRLLWQQQILQEELIQTRARLCDLSMEMEQAWSEYEFLEEELECLRAPRELMSRCGDQQERAAAQRDLWMMQDVMLGLRNNKNNFHVAIESTRHPAMAFAVSPILDHHSLLPVDSLQSVSPLPSPGSRQPTAHYGPLLGVEDAPCRPPLPQAPYHDERTTSARVETEPASPVAQREQKHQDQGDLQPQPSVTNGQCKEQLELTVGGPGRRPRMSAEEQMERMKRHLQARSQDRDRPRTARAAQRSVVVSPVARGPVTEQKSGTPGSHPGIFLGKRQQTSHLSWSPLTTSAVASQNSPGNSPTVRAQTAATETPGAPRVVTSSKLVTKILPPPARVENQARENNRLVRKECKPSQVTLTSRYIDVDPDPPFSPGQLQEKQRTPEEVKTVITKPS